MTQVPQQSSAIALAWMSAPMIWPPQITSRDLVLMAHYSAAVIFTQSTRPRETRQVRYQSSVNCRLGNTRCLMH
jgi:hypothetical protein